MVLADGLERSIRSFLAAGYQLDKDAFKFLKLIGEKNDLETLTSSTLSHLASATIPQLIVTRALLETVALKISPLSPQPPSSAAPNVMASPKPLASEISSRLQILNDPSKNVGSGGTVEDFARYFRRRFECLRNIFEERLDTRGAGNIDSALKGRQDSVRFICMITEKRDRITHILLVVEDEESQATLLVEKKRHEAYEAAQSAPLDQVVYVEAKHGRGDFLVCEKLILPDVPEHKTNRSSEPVCAALLSDIHVGSKKFMKEVFNRVVLWLNCRVGDSRQRELAGRVKYVIIAGDLVDGVGIYPDQEDELAIADVYSQYRLAAQYIEQIPDYIEIILIPGNHDPTRQSLPQPQVAPEFAEPVYRAREVRSLGNPAEVGLHGVRFLLYHGKSLDDVIATIPGMTFQSPHTAMEFLLRCRHLAPEYGNRTSIAPEGDDYLVIENIPDVFHAGHIHINGMSRYRGTTIVNSGAWQEQTDFQRRVGLEPTPGILPILDLQRVEALLVDFKRA